MSEQDRGAYAPQTDAPLAFDARQPRGGGGGGPAPLTLLVSAIVLMAMVVGLLLFYRHGVRHPGQAPELVGAPVAQTKAAPASGASPGDQAAGLQVYKAEATPPSETRPLPSFETPPEQPAPLPAARPVQPPPAVIAQAPLRGTAAPPAAPAPKPAAPKPVVVAKAAPPPAPAATQPVAAAPSSDASYVAGSAFGAHPAAPPRAAPSAAKAAAKPVAPDVAAAAPAATSAATAKPKAKPKTPSVSPETASASTAPAESGGAAMAQIGAFSTAALAQKGWSDDAHALPGAMAGKSRKVEAATKDGKTFYRAYVGGFASKADAASFCAALKAKNKPCFVK